MNLTATITNTVSLNRRLNRARDKENRKLFTAMRVTGFRLRKTMQDEIRAGAPGGQRFAPKREITRGRRTNTALRRLAVAVRYWTKKNPDEVHVGFSGPRLSKSWKRIARIQQEGFSRRVSRETRAYLRRRGERVGKRSKYRKYYFIKKSTTHFKTPARPIVGPFWRKHQRTAWRMIRINYRRKIEGQRI